MKSLLVDGESAALDLTYENALSQQLALPFHRAHHSRQRRGAGFRHRRLASGCSASRAAIGPTIPKKQIDYSYSGGASIDLHHPQTSIGDIAADVGWYAVDDARRTAVPVGGTEGAHRDRCAELDQRRCMGRRLVGCTPPPAGRRGSSPPKLGVAQPFGDEIFAGWRIAVSVLRAVCGHPRVGQRRGRCVRNSTAKPAASPAATCAFSDPVCS